MDLSKDQSYFLFGLTQEQLAHAAFPLGELSKQAVREIARRANLPVAEKAESQEICFVPSGDYTQFHRGLSRKRAKPSGPERSRANPRASEIEPIASAGEVSESGELVSTSGEVLGHHAGVQHFTVGQRRGLGIAAGRPLYVLQIDPASRRVIVGDEDRVAPRRLARFATSIGSPGADCEKPIEADGQDSLPPRARCRASSSLMGPADARVRFAAPQRAITPGQAAVFYRGDQVLGGGWIR